MSQAPTPTVSSLSHNGEVTPKTLAPAITDVFLALLPNSFTFTSYFSQPVYHQFVAQNTSHGRKHPILRRLLVRVPITSSARACDRSAQRYPAENFADKSSVHRTASHDRTLDLPVLRSISPCRTFPLLRSFLHCNCVITTVDLKATPRTLISPRVFPCPPVDTARSLAPAVGTPREREKEKRVYLQPPVHDGGTASHSAATPTACLRGHTCVQRVHRTSHTERTLQRRFPEPSWRGDGVQFNQCQSHWLDPEPDFLHAIWHLLSDRVRQPS